MRYTKASLRKLEATLSEYGYRLCYEKGRFQAGYCILKNNRIVLVNSYFTLEGKINCLIDIIKEIEVDLAKPGRERDTNQKIHSKVT